MIKYETFLETKKFHVKNVIVHEKYERNYEKDISRHDIALLELEEEVDLSVYTPVCLPSSVKNRDNTPALALGKGRVHLIFFIIWNCAKLWFMEFPQVPSLIIITTQAGAGQRAPIIQPSIQ